MRTKEEIYNEATLKSYAENPMGTREDVIHIAMEMYAKEYHEAEVLKLNKANVIPAVCDHRYHNRNGRYMLYEQYCEKCGEDISQTEV